MYNIIRVTQGSFDVTWVVSNNRWPHKTGDSIDCLAVVNELNVVTKTFLHNFEFIKVYAIVFVFLIPL